jgi:hypothetical protein
MRRSYSAFWACTSCSVNRNRAIFSGSGLEEASGHSIGTACYDNNPCVRNSSIKRENRAFSASTSAKINCSASIFASSRV